MTTEFSQLAILAFASVFAGFIDSVVGGGGLIQIPAIFSVLPKELPATLFGTNKIASVFGTANAAWRYSRRVSMPWGTTLPAAAAAFACAYLGAMCVAWLPRDLLRPMILVMLRRHAQQTLFCTALATILGGAIGNLIDRLLHGHVVDFLLFHWNQWYFPAFNVADIAITCGAALLILDEILRMRRERRQRLHNA